MRRGEIWIGNLNPSRGAEAGKIRPVLVIEAHWLSGLPGETIVVLPLTTQVRPEMHALRPVLPPREGLMEQSQVLVDQPRTLDRHRIGAGPVARLHPGELAMVSRSLAFVLGLEGA